MEKWALVTGASAGIGRELADVLAGNGFSLVLVARSQPRLEASAAELESRNKIHVKVLPRDLSQPNAAASIFESLRDVPVSVLVNDAGFGSYGPFADADLGVQSGMIQLNVVALVQLTHLFVQAMR